MRHPVHGLAVLTPFLLTLAMLFTTSLTCAVAVGDQVALKARILAGVPLHQEPRGTPDFQRVPDGTKATVMGLAQDSRWLKLALSEGRTGWVTSSYIGDLTEAPSTGPSRAAKPPLRIEEGVVEHVADGDTVTVITPNQTKLRIRMLGIDAPETPKGTKFPGQPYGPEAEAYLKQLVDGKHVRVEIFGVDRYKRLLSTLFIEGKTLT
jgi:nuclease-like protein